MHRHKSIYLGWALFSACAAQGAPPRDSGAEPDARVNADGGHVLTDAGHDGGHVVPMRDGGHPTEWGLVPDPSFGEGGVVGLNGSTFDAWNALSCAVAGDGSIAVAGSTDDGRALFVRVGSNGELDTTFGDRGAVQRSYGGSSALARDVFVLPDGRVVALVLGSYHGVVRLAADGAPDATFDGDGIAVPNIFGVSIELGAIAAQDDGRVLVAGRVWESPILPSRHDFYFARYRADGSLDPMFDGDGQLQISIASSTDEGALTVADSSTRLLFGGVTGSGSSTIVGRLDSYGALDSGFGTGGTLAPASQTGSIDLIALGSGGALHASDLHLSRFGFDGAPDASFGTSGTVAIDGCHVRAAAARENRDAWVACEEGSALHGVDWSGSPVAGGEPLPIPPVALATGLGSDIHVADLCAGSDSSIVAVGNVSESTTGLDRGIFVARFASSP